ncbi:hypothetical protein G6F57_022892 [Rhizopus arrhizus]|nr:hypothetical protein G6F57_022892 [Rhizopus arrhizus]
MRQATGAGGGMADRLPVQLQQPHRVIRVGQDHALALDRVGLPEEGLQVLRRVQMAEGFGERAGGQRRQGRRVVHGGAADGIHAGS